jgi:protein SCO1
MNTRKSNLFSSLILGFFISIIVITLGVDGFGQRLQHYNSPLYAPKTYDPNVTTSNGLPPVFEKVGIVQHLNEQIPLDTEFKNEEGKIVKLGEVIGKRPVILALVYYECPMLCNEVLNGLVGSLKGISFDAGKEFDILAISFDARENEKPELAQRKKEGYLERYERNGVANGFHFLTGTQDSIDKITNAVGFNYVFDESTNQFAHNGGIMILTPEGKISRYFYGIDYSSKDLKFGIMESSKGNIGNAAEQLLLYCFHYDPSKGKYGLAILNVIRLGGVATLFGLGTFFYVFWQRNKKKVIS